MRYILLFAITLAMTAQAAPKERFVKICHEGMIVITKCSQRDPKMCAIDPNAFVRTDKPCKK